MNPTLLDLVRRHADAHADRLGTAPTPIPGLTAVRAIMPDMLQVAVNRPLVALLLQGRKRVTMGENSFEFGAGESLVISADVPTVSQILRASPAAPYYSLVLELDPALTRELILAAGSPLTPGAPVRIEPTDDDVSQAALRLMRLIDRPAALPVLGDAALREMHYWLLVGRQGSTIRGIGAPDGRADRIARAVAVIRRDVARSIRVGELAELAGMSPSSFHQHFRAVTTLSPLRFQKQLRLIEARRRMLAEGAGIATAAHAVGYESVPQFTRDYRRLFGAPPGRDMRRGAMDPSCERRT